MKRVVAWSVGVVVAAGAMAAGTGTAEASVVFADGFEGANNWTTTSTLPGSGWSLLDDASAASSPTHAWFCDEPITVGDASLISPVITATDSSMLLSFEQRYDLETGFDGGVLEISVNGGTFNYVGAAAFKQNGYNEVLSTVTGNPLGGLSAFTGMTAGAGKDYVQTVVDLSGLVAADDTFRISFRRATDANFTGAGWFVDDVAVTDGVTTAGTTTGGTTTSGTTTAGTTTGGTTTAGTTTTGTTTSGGTTGGTTGGATTAGTATAGTTTTGTTTAGTTTEGTTTEGTTTGGTDTVGGATTGGDGTAVGGLLTTGGSTTGGATTGGSTTGGNPVPEPASGFLLALAGLGLIRRRR